ncbi:MAG TPA: anaerobic sulfatase maturase [bacterium]|nr:anaerobic sulfatase maturase [bacterium]HPN45323.1 anaerobic sulfatase maturase [bacterium]
MPPPLSRPFQIFVKPTGPLCNLGCAYCYYLDKKALFAGNESLRMSDAVLESYIQQHLQACPDPEVRFSWHGGEPTLLGIDYFRKIVALQMQYQSPKLRIINGIQTNGTLLNEEWCRFLSEEQFNVGVSMDGPPELHDLYRVTRNNSPTHHETLRGLELLQKHGIAHEILCVVNAANSQRPLRVYRYFKQLGVKYFTFLPLVEPQPGATSGVTPRSVQPQAWGNFLCTIFDEWQERDIGAIKVQIFEEAARSAFGQEHTLCIFRPVCGDVPVLEHNGDFYSCDHYVDAQHCIGNICTTPLTDLLDHPAQRAFGQAKLSTLPRYCRECTVRDMCNGECPKNRFITTPDGEPGLNYLCAGYKQFFSHCRPFVNQIAALWRQQSGGTIKAVVPAANIGRNDPCPCGSGKKYKKCCMTRG